MFKKITAFIAVFAMLSIAVTGCGPEEGTTTTATNEPAETEAVTETEEETLTETEAAAAAVTEAALTAIDPASVTDRRDFVITLYPEYAPITCENFEKLVTDGFYNGITFHRIVDGFMAQGGDPLGNGTGGSDNTIKGEFSSNGVDNKLSHKRGVISMARSTDPDSASSQFFICYSDDCTFLDGSYAAFGEVTDGMEVIDAFLAVPRSFNSMGEEAVPLTPVSIKEAVMIDPDENGNPRVKVTMNDFIGSGEEETEENSEAEADVTEAEAESEEAEITEESAEETED